MQSVPWWLESGPAQCEVCERHYHIEAGYHCADCDAPLCSACVFYERITQRVLCAGCAQQQEAS